jgi:hypothetical protein
VNPADSVLRGEFRSIAVVFQPHRVMEDYTHLPWSSSHAIEIDLAARGRR